MKNFLNFLNSSAGLLILGFLLTTGLGAVLNLVIQNQRSHNERGFEIYKTRLVEAKTLQENLLEQSTARFFYLEQILGKLEDPPEKTQEYWKKNYNAVKDDWNKKVVNFHAQMRILFTGNLPSLLFSDYEDPITTEGLVRKNLQYMRNKDEYEKNTPKTIHGAFVDAHATIYHMVFICQKTTEENDCKEWDNLMELAHRQMVHLKLMHSCLSYGISGQLLVDPYGPQKESRTPKQCDEVFTKAARHDNQSEQKFGPRQFTSKTEN
jgi:hypothetical protein